MNCGRLCEHFRHDENEQHIAKLAAMDLGIPEGVDIQSEFKDSLKHMHEQQQKQAQSELFSATSIHQLTDEQKEQLRALTRNRKPK